ncbi:MAG: hypothetical protein HY298_26590 [Verrucomicrobia bacterium]|nr:hypothetical protein [Verrucomicrobiota bacterium]
MNNSDLERVLKSAEVSARSDEYWEQFPKRVTANTHWQSQTAGKFTTEKPRRLTLATSLKRLALASACVAVGLVIGFWRGQAPDETVLSLTQAKKYFREIEILFPNQLQAIVFDEQGARLILGEKADVPNSPPVYLRICGPHGCQTFVTFSGQQIRVNRDEFDVLLDAKGNVMLVGRRFVWSSASLGSKTSPYRIEARTLETPS